MDRLTAAVERHALARHHDRVGRVEEVWCGGGPSKTDPSVLSGRTRQNKLVHFPPAPASAAAPDPGAAAPEPGSYAEVRVVRAAPHWLSGELVGVSRRAGGARTRLPVASR